MKTFIQVLAFLALWSCAQDVPNKLEIPELLNRGDKIQYFNEWSDVRRNYGDLKHALTKNPENVKAWSALTQLFINEARITGEHGHYYPAALTCVNKILDQSNLTNDEKFLALGMKANVELSLHHFDQALQIAEAAKDLNPHNASIYGALVDAHVELGNYQKAVECVDKMTALRPDLRSYARTSYLREIYGMPKESIEAMKMAVDAGSPGSEEKAWAALQLAGLFLKYGQVMEAEMVLNKILEERPDYPFAVAALGDVYLKMNEPKKAEDALKAACAIIPELSFYIDLAKLYKMQGRKQEMNDMVKQILEMFKDDESHGHCMDLEYAKFYLEVLDNPEKALEYMTKEQQSRPENIEVNLLLSKIYLAKRDTMLSKQFLIKASSTGSKNPELIELTDKVIMQ